MRVPFVVPTLSRRELLEASGLGLGAVVLSYLLKAGEVSAIEQHGETQVLPLAPRAKAVIMLVQNGGPSQMDLFDPKPELTRQAGKTMTVETFQKGNSDKLMASPLTFRAYGECGMEMTTLLPHLGSVADELCLVRSMFSEHNNHTEGLVLLNTGKIFPGRPASERPDQVRKLSALWQERFDEFCQQARQDLPATK